MLSEREVSVVSSSGNDEAMNPMLKAILEGHEHVTTLLSDLEPASVDALQTKNATLFKKGLYARKEYVFAWYKEQCLSPLAATCMTLPGDMKYSGDSRL